MRIDPQLPSGSGRDDDLELPEALRSDLGALLRPGSRVTREVDESVLGAARAELSPPAARRWRPWLVRVVPAAAAAGFLAWWGLQTVRPRAVPAAIVTPAGAADLDGSGRVDVLDAFALARSLERPTAPPDQAWDFNADGGVDRADVEHLARLAVRIDS